MYSLAHLQHSAEVHKYLKGVNNQEEELPVLVQSICDLVGPRAVVQRFLSQKPSSHHPEGKNGYLSYGTSVRIQQDSLLGTGERAEVSLSRVVDAVLPEFGGCFLI